MTSHSSPIVSDVPRNSVNLPALAESDRINAFMDRVLVEREDKATASVNGNVFSKRLKGYLPMLISDVEELPKAGVNTSLLLKAKIIMNTLGYTPRYEPGEGEYKGYHFSSASVVVNEYFRRIDASGNIKSFERDEFGRYDKASFYIFYAAALAAERPDVAIELLRNRNRFSFGEVKELDDEIFFMTTFNLFHESFLRACEKSINSSSTEFCGPNAYVFAFNNEKNAGLFRRIIG